METENKQEENCYDPSLELLDALRIIEYLNKDVSGALKELKEQKYIVGTYKWENMALMEKVAKLQEDLKEANKKPNRKMKARYKSMETYIRKLETEKVETDLQLKKMQVENQAIQNEKQALLYKINQLQAAARTPSGFSPMSQGFSPNFSPMMPPPMHLSRSPSFSRAASFSYPQQMQMGRPPPLQIPVHHNMMHYPASFHQAGVPQSAPLPHSHLYSSVARPNAPTPVNSQIGSIEE